MIIEAQEIIKRQNLIGDTEGFDMSLSADDMQWIMTLLSDLYKDPYSIVIQEWCSNAWDSHLEANKKHEPIVLEIKKDEIADKWYVAVQDFGVGLGPDRIKIFGAYGKSTKRDSNDLIGGFGVGSKSIMCYTKSFFVDTCFDGIKYLYSINPNEEGIPRIDLLHEEETELSNRSRLWFYLKKDTSNYYSKSTPEGTKFLEGAKRKTAYFDNLVYDLDSSLDNLNSYKRIEGNHFVYSEMQPFNNLHILLGQVPYELDFQLLGLSTINVPIAVKISEGVMPVPTREAIKYSDKSIQVIKEAIKLASTELVEYCNRNRVDVTDWKVWLKTRDSQPRVMLGKHEIFINELVKYSTTPLKEVVFTPLKDVEDVTNLGRGNLFPFKCVGKIQNGRKSDNRLDWIKYTDGDKKLSIEGQFKSKVNSHIGKSDSLVYVFRKENYKLKDYKSLLMLKRSNRETWRSQIQAYQKFVENEWLTIDSYDNIIVPKEVKVKGVRTTKPRDVVNINILREREKYDSTFKSATDVHPIKDFDDKQFNKLCIYGIKDDTVTLDAIWRCVPKQSILLFHCTENNHKYLDKHNFIHVKNWHKTKAFSRMVTAYKIEEVLDKNERFTGECNWRGNYQEGLYSNNLKKLSSTYKDLVEELYKYRNKNLKENGSSGFNKTFMESCVETANTEKLWDYSIYHKIQQLEDMIEKFKFVEVFKPDANWLPVAANYIKKVTKNVRLDLKYYQTKNN